jgi:enoyl-CoA hydratase/carnithine racemase
VPREALEDFVLGLASDIAAGAPLALRGMKQVIGFCQAHDLTPEDEAEAARLIADSFASEDLVEGQTAFLEGRKPSFRGK